MSAEQIEQPVVSKKTKPSSVALLTAHCRSGSAETLPDGRVRHPSCPGSGENGRGSLWFCRCECHTEVPTCRFCRQPDVELTLEGYCVDQEGCEGAMARHQQANPVWQQLQALKAETEARETEIAQIRAEARRNQREREAAEAQRTGRPAPVAKVRAAKPASTPQRCHCGCGYLTKGGRFRAGDDAKLKGTLIRAARGEGTKADAVRAMAELIARDWPRKNIDAKIAEKAEDLIDRYGIDKIVELAVAKRYGEG